MKINVTILMFALILLASCKPSETFFERQVHADDIHTVSSNLNLFVPRKCKVVGEYIYKDLRSEKFRQRYVDDTLQALVDLSICLNDNGYEKEAAEMGFETLLLSEVSRQMPENLELVVEIVSDSRWHTYAERSWADWTFTSKLIDIPNKVESFDDLPVLPENVSKKRNLMIMNKTISLRDYFDQLQDLKNE